MKNLSILTVIISILTFSSCEEDPIMGCTDATAINYNADATESDDSCEYESLSVSDQILGSWTIDSADVSMLFSEDMLSLLLMASQMYTAEEFEEEMGFPMPSSQAEWDDIALNGVPVDDAEVSGLVMITNSTFTVTDLDDVTQLDYQLINDQTIQFSSNDSDFDYFDILEVSESNLVLSTTIIYVDDDDPVANVETMMVIYLSK